MKTKIIEEDMERMMNSETIWDRLNGKNVWITGATGMIPSYMVIFLLYLNEKKSDFYCHVTAQVRNIEKARKLFGEYWDKPYLKVIQSDVCLPAVTERKADYIIHAASPASPQLFTTMPVDTIKPNVIGTYYLLEMAKEQSVDGFLLFSSGDVYGQTAEGQKITEKSLGTVDQLNTRNSYAEGKRMAEMMCRAYMEQFHVPVKIARISHTYGPTVNFEGDRRVFSEFVQNIIRGEDIIMQSAGTAVRPFCYLTDAVAGLFKIMLEGKAGEAYNLCNDECNISIRELAERLVKLFPEKNLKVVCKERGKEDSYKESLVKKPCQVDNSKLRALGWKPVVGLEEGFRRTVQNFEENK